MYEDPHLFSMFHTGVQGQFHNGVHHQAVIASRHHKKAPYEKFLKDEAERQRRTAAERIRLKAEAEAAERVKAGILLQKKRTAVGR